MRIGTLAVALVMSLTGGGALLDSQSRAAERPSALQTAQTGDGGSGLLGTLTLEQYKSRVSELLSAQAARAERNARLETQSSADKNVPRMILRQPSLSAPPQRGLQFADDPQTPANSTRPSPNPELDITPAQNLTTARLQFVSPALTNAYASQVRRQAVAEPPVIDAARSAAVSPVASTPVPASQPTHRPIEPPLAATIESAPRQISGPLILNPQGPSSAPVTTAHVVRTRPLAVAPHDSVRRDPREVVDRFHQVLFDVGRKHDRSDFKGRRDLLMQTIPDTFHTSEMAQFAMGEHWNRLTNSQRRIVTEGYTAQLSAMLADRFGFDYGQDFETGQIEPDQGGYVWAAAEVVMPFGYRVPLRYLLRDDGGHLKILDLLPGGGVSALQTRRDEYHAVIRRRGLNGFLSAIKQKTGAILSR